MASVSAAALTLAACTAPSAPASDPPASTGTASSSTTHWSYDEDGGAAEWAALSPEWSACSTGTPQSPIDLPRDAPSGAGATVLTGAVEIEEADTGLASQVTAEDRGSTVIFSGASYDLLQIHAHTPAEHTVDGVAHAAEIHLVHTDSAGRLLVLALFAEEGARSDEWQPVIDTATAEDGADAIVDIADLLPATASTWTYEGSLTTPPCTEGIRWVVFEQPVTLSPEQVEALDAAHHHNSRGVQPLGDREIVRAVSTVSPGVD
ncbi:carbonic anhydrase [Frigoribacterium sp. MCBA15_019]|uniref:carbonic anhydrase n=1 Tax=Frigoribacterium sp. MCBA15_019 TaxID=1898745 RepID=UPI0015A72AE9|nr:carbonic anhydrase family protein [Frigoribacterium sp. MCBA15_019]